MRHISLNIYTYKSATNPFVHRVRQGFTIVELLIVVVVIAIITAVIAVGYNGITGQATEVSMKSDLDTAAGSLALDLVRNKSYPMNASSANGGNGLAASGDNSLSYTRADEGYCLTVSSTRVSKTFYIASANGKIKEGSCNDAGDNWTARSIPAGTWSGIAYGNGSFMVVGGGNLSAGTEAPPSGITSANGVDWSSTFPVGTGAAVPSDLLYTGSAFVVKMGTGRVLSAISNTNGQTWQHQAPAGTVSGYQGNSLAYGAGVYVATVAPPPETYSRVFTSTDGSSWTNRITTIPWTGWTSVAYGNGTFVAVASSGTARVMTSPDGITWTAQTAAAANAWTSVTYGNGKFVAVANSGAHRAMVSADGINWTLSNAPEQSGWTSVAYGNGKYVAVANAGTNRVMTSTDGAIWTARSASEANTWASIAYGNGCFVAIASSGTNRVMTSCW